MADPTLVFGTDSSTEFGVVQNRKKGKKAEIAEGRNHVGEVIAQKAYSIAHEITVEVLFDAAVTLPEAGDKVTYETKEWLVSDCEETDSSTEFKKASLTLTRKDSAVLTPKTTPAP